MKKKNSARRDFMKLAAAGIGGLVVTPTTGLAGKSLELHAPVDQNKKLKIVCLGAHPGDPEFGCGGTMAKYGDAGHAVIFLYVTRGEASDPGKSHNEMAALRTKEAEAASKFLNATPRFLGQIDGDTVLDKRRNEEAEKMILAESPDIVFTQWPVDAHPDHQITGLFALTAWERSARKFHLYFYEVNTGVETMAFTPTDYVDITSVRERKKQAMFAHKTQNPVETYSKYFKPLEEFRGLEAGVLAAEGFIHFKAADERARIIGL